MDLLNNLSVDMSTEDLSTVVIILLATCAFITFWFLTQSVSVRTKLWSHHTPDEQSFRHFLFSKFSGFIVLGVVPCWILVGCFDEWELSDLGLYWNSTTSFQTIEWIAVLLLLVVPLVYLSAKKPKNLVNYPQIRTIKWTSRIFYWNLIGWAFYLMGYELLFRGVLFFPLIKLIGFWPASALNCALYATTHIPKGLDETVGALVLGAVLCLLTAATDTIWIALIVHIAMAWTNSLTALYYHPVIQFERWKKR
jgi:membrane protease YdiL (CAAX protease family)